MRFCEFAIKPIKPLTPPQARIYALKKQKEQVGKLLSAEKDRQKKQKATQQIQQAQKVLKAPVK